MATFSKVIAAVWILAIMTGPSAHSGKISSAKAEWGGVRNNQNQRHPNPDPRGDGSSCRSWFDFRSVYNKLIYWFDINQIGRSSYDLLRTENDLRSMNLRSTSIMSKVGKGAFLCSARRLNAQYGKQRSRNLWPFFFTMRNPNDVLCRLSKIVSSKT